MKAKAPTKDARGAIMLSGVKCPRCPFRHSFGVVTRAHHEWFCGACGHVWIPTVNDILLFNSRVAPRDQIAIK